MTRAMRQRGFSLIELLIVVAIMSALVGGAVLRTDALTEEARVTTLRHNLRVLRQSIDDFRIDQRRYPERMLDLVARRYLREVPVDPTSLTTDSWVLIPSRAGARDVADVRSSTAGYGAY